MAKWVTVLATLPVVPVDLQVPVLYMQEVQAVQPIAPAVSQEQAAAVAFLLSDEASYVTGIAMPVDGGFLSSGARGL